jgi:hypothetical protein
VKVKVWPLPARSKTKPVAAGPAVMAAGDYDLLTIYSAGADGSEAEARGARYDASAKALSFSSEGPGAFRAARPF